MSTKLHLGSGDFALPGWINLDLLPYPEVDRVVDLTKGFPYEDVSYIYAEHFVEHLLPNDLIQIFQGCRRALNEGGVFRLSTPNLDWVLETHYRPQEWSSPSAAVDQCFALNKAFHGWGHRFLFNRQTLEAFLREAGFARVVFVAYGESGDPELRGLERHARSGDTPNHQHVLIAEASGRGAVGSSGTLDVNRIDYHRDAEMPFHLLQYSLLWAIRLISRTGRFLLGRRSGS